MTSEFSVDTQALRKMAQVYQDAADQWNSLVKDLGGWTLDEGDLGVIGRQSKVFSSDNNQTNVISDYNSAVQTILGKTTTSATGMETAQKDLNAAATHYTEVEDASTAGMNKMAGKMP